MIPGTIYRHKENGMTVEVVEIQDRLVKALVTDAYHPAPFYVLYDRVGFVKSVGNGKYEIVNVKRRSEIKQKEESNHGKP